MASQSSKSPSLAMSVKGSTPDISEDCSDKSFQKTVTLQKNYGKTGALKTDDGTFYIGSYYNINIVLS